MELPPIDPVSSAKPLLPSHRVNPAGDGNRQPREVPPRSTPNDPTSRTGGARGGNSIANRVELLEQALPMEILKDTTMVRSEWAWRRLLMERSGTTPESGSTPHDNPPAQATTQTEHAIGYMRTLLTSLADVGGSEDWQVFVPGTPASTLVQFNEVRTHEQLNALPDKVKKWVMHDRLVSSTRDASTPKTGGGLFFPGPESSDTTRAVGPFRERPAIRWRAESQTRISGQGKHVHRITMELRVRDAPVQITVVSSKPALYVHIASNEERLLQRIDQASNHLRNAMSGIGWQVDGFSTGSLNTGDERP